MMNRSFALILCLFVLSSTIKAQTGSSESISKKINMYWDSSLSMQDKDLNKEIELLDKYFQYAQDVDINLITFSNSINLQQTFHVENSNWKVLKDALLNTNYDGMAAYDVLLTEQESDISFLFTDGIGVIDKIKINKSTPTYVISSTRKVNSSKLKIESLSSGGNFINLNLLSISEALQKLKVKADVNPKTTLGITKKASKKEEVTGRIYSTEGVLIGATVGVKGRSKGVITDAKGVFSIEVIKGDVLEISYLGKTTKSIIIDNTEEVFDVYLIGKENQLDEVLVTGEVPKEQETVEIGFRRVNKEKLGYAVKTIDSKSLTSANATNISDAVRGKMGGVNYLSGSDISETIFRNGEAGLLLGGKGASPYALIVIDGVALQRALVGGQQGQVEMGNMPDQSGVVVGQHGQVKMGNMPRQRASVNGQQGQVKMGNMPNKLLDFIDPENIASITILKGLAATNRFGNEGVGGVILIKTKMALAGKKSKKPNNSALVRGNDFTESLAEVNNSISHLPYIKALNKHQTLNEVYTAYLTQRNKHLQDPLYFVNVSDYIAQWDDKDLSSKILTNILELHPKDVSLLKLVGYKAEQQGDKFLAKRIYEKLMQLKPKDAQSYRDLALIYQETGYYQEALDIYTNIHNNRYPEVSFYGVKKNLESEMKRLILLHKVKLDLTNVPIKYLKIKKVACDVRLVFDWNDSTADFELQFVNPQQKFFTWTHTKIQDTKRIEREQIQGFNSEEFLLVGAVKGEWLINVESKLENASKPMIIKYTVYKNYGMANETKVTKLLILNNITEKQMLGKIVI